MHTLSISVAKFMSFMHSAAFKGVLIIAALLFDIFTTSLGMAPFVFKKLDMLFLHAGMEKSYGAIFSVAVCALAAALMAGSLTVASMHKKHFSAFLIGVAAFFVSFGGVASGMFKINSFADVNFDTLISFMCVLAFSGGPILYYSLNSKLVYEQFGNEITAINLASSEAISKAMIKDAKDAVKASETQNEAGWLKRTFKHAKSIAQSSNKMDSLKKPAPAIGASTDIDALLKSLNPN